MLSVGGISLGMQDTLRALADPTRREILNLLKKSRLAAGEIGDHFSISGAAVSRHLSVLKDPCNDCKYCMPCPYGLDIPAVLLHYNKCINEGNVPASSQDENYRKARRAFLIGYDRSVPRLRQASHCIGCDQCVHHCPQGINIPKEMQRIDHFVEDLKQERVF